MYKRQAQKDGHTYGLVVLGSDLDNIYREASEILDWAFASFSDRELEMCIRDSLFPLSAGL